MKYILFISIMVLFSACGEKQQVTVIECKSVVTEQNGKHRLRLKPTSTEEGKIENGMLDEEGFLDHVEEFELDVNFPDSYKVTLTKTTEREGIYRNAPLHLIYNIQMEGIW